MTVSFTPIETTDIKLRIETATKMIDIWAALTTSRRLKVGWGESFYL